MNTIVSIPTVLICTSISTTIVAMSLSYLWLNDKREPAIGWWCMSMWAATFGAVVLATRTALPPWFSLGLGNLILTLAFGSAWAGFVAFSGRKPSRTLVVAGAAVWAVCYYGIEPIRADVNYRIFLISIVYATYGLMVVRISMLGWKSERLPSFIATGVLFALHSALYVARVLAAILYPATEENGVIIAPWVAAVALEGFALTVFSAFLFMSLVKERAERRYRLAAEIDSLTSVSSRRFFVSETRRTLAQRPDSAVLAVMDLDFFKKVNDTYGHMAGDRLLQSFASNVLVRLRSGMVFGRLGGEEFGLFMPDISETEAAAFLEQVRAGVEALEIPFNGNVLKVTTSIGAASIDDAGLDFDHLMAGADNALYLCKNQGRNQVRFFTPAMRLEKVIEEGEEMRVTLSGKRVSRLSVRSHQRRG